MAIEDRSIRECKAGNLESCSAQTFIRKGSSIDIVQSRRAPPAIRVFSGSRYSRSTGCSYREPLGRRAIDALGN